MLDSLTCTYFLCFFTSFYKMESTSRCPPKRRTPPKMWSNISEQLPSKICKNKTWTIPKKKLFPQKMKNEHFDPPWNEQLAPENGWLEYYCPIGFRPIFRCELFVSGRVNPSVFLQKYLEPRSAWSIEFTLRAFETWIPESKLRGINGWQSVFPNNWQSPGNPKISLEMYTSIIWMLMYMYSKYI